MIKATFNKVVILLLASFIYTAAASAQSLQVLRDAETEAFLRRIGTPIFKAAKLTPENVTLHLLADNSINAFVSGGQHIFFNSGLILAMDNVDELRGVLAHETGHIAGGHAVRFKDAMSKAGNFSIASLVLGALAVAAGSPDAGIAIMMAGQQMSYGSILAYSRTQEASTDQAGAVFLQRAGISGKGMIEFFYKLREQELIYAASQNPYMRTHPLTTDRIQNLDQVIKSSPHFDTPPDKDLNDQFKRIQAKLEGYIRGPNHILNKYPLSDQSLYAKYARVYAYHKTLEWKLALAEVDDLIKMEPENPYFYEIKGQILFESGQLKQSLTPFEKAVKIEDSPLILTAYAQALLSIEGQSKPFIQENLDQALPLLKEATRLDPENGFAWFNLAKVYSYMGKDELASLATAERYFIVGDMSNALRHADYAKGKLKRGSIEWLRAEDITMIARQAVESSGKKGKKNRFNLSVNSGSH